MATPTMKCKNCGTEIELSEAFIHQFEEQAQASLEVQHKIELENAKKFVEESTLKKAEKQFE